MALRISILLLLFSYTLQAQKNKLALNRYMLSGGLGLSSDSTNPFFQQMNQWGEVPRNAPFFQLKGSIHNDYDSTYSLSTRKLRKFDWGFGASAATFFNTSSIDAVLSEGYLKARWRIFEVWGGRRKMLYGYQDSTLSLGGLIWSQNALPLPKVEIAIPNYTPLWKNGILAIKGQFSHGWFGPGDSVQQVLLHQKSFYVRLGKAAWKWQAHGGFNHQVQWAGRPTNPFIDRITGETVNQFSSGLGTFLQVVTGVSLNRDGDGLQTGAPSNEALNRAGNHLGTIDIGLSYAGKMAKLQIYRQSIYEDGSLFYLNNIADGLTGLSLNLPKFQALKKVLVEYIRTSNQGGPGGSSSTINELRGRDNYFNNSIYRDNWTYRNRMLGNPIIRPVRDLEGENFTNFPSNYLLNNRIEAIHVGMEGELWLSYQVHLVYSQNLGNYSQPLNFLKQSYWSVVTSKTLPKFTLFLQLSGDTGDLVGSRMGAFTGICYHW